MDGSTHIQIDDRRQSDKSGLFCKILVRIAPDGNMTIMFSHAPMNRDIRQLIHEHGGRIIKLDGKTRVIVPITEGDGLYLRDLAKCFRQAIRIMPGQHGYKDPNWKWKCPRIAGSLEDFAQTLDDFCILQAEVSEGGLA